MSRHRLMYCLTTYSALAALYLLPFSADSIRIGSLRGRAVLAALYGLLAITSLASEEHRTGRKLFDLLKVPLGTFQAAIVLVMCFRLPLWSLQQWPLVILAALSLALLFLTQSTRLETAPPSTASENSVPARLRTATLLMVPMAAAFVVGAQSSAAPVTRRGLNVPDGLLFTFEGQQRIAEWVRQQPRVAFPIDTVANEATVVVREFTDYQCPACREAHMQYGPVLRSLSVQLGDRFSYQRLDYPLNSDCNRFVPKRLHPDACVAAIAAKAADRAQESRAFDDWAFSHQAELAEERLAEILGKLGAMTLWNQRREELRTALKHDIELGGQLGITGTPTFFVNGIDVSGLTPKAFEALVLVESRAVASPPPAR